MDRSRVVFSVVAQNTWKQGGMCSEWKMAGDTRQRDVAMRKQRQEGG
jgi:hypothetical protein